MQEEKLNLNDAIEKIEKIKSTIDTAFEEGEIDFDIIKSDLDSLKNNLESKLSRVKNIASEFIPSQALKINDFK